MPLANSLNHARVEYKWSLQQPGEPAGQRFLTDGQFTVLKDGDSAEWGMEIVVIEDQDIWQFPDSSLQIGERARMAAVEFLGREVLGTGN